MYPQMFDSLQMIKQQRLKRKNPVREALYYSCKQTCKEFVAT